MVILLPALLRACFHGLSLVYLLSTVMFLSALGSFQLLLLSPITEYAHACHHIVQIKLLVLCLVACKFSSSNRWSFCLVWCDYVAKHRLQNSCIMGLRSIGCKTVTWIFLHELWKCQHILHITGWKLNWENSVWKLNCSDLGHRRPIATKRAVPWIFWQCTSILFCFVFPFLTKRHKCLTSIFLQFDEYS